MRIDPLRLPEEREAAAALLEEYPYRPYRAYRQAVEHPAYPEFARERLLGMLEKSARVLAARDGRRIEGAASFRRLPWDSEIFGLEAGRVELLHARGEYTAARGIEERLLGGLLEEARAEGVRHLTLRVDAGDLAAIHAAGALGFELIDGIQVFSRRVPERVELSRNGFAVRPYGPRDMEQVLAIARTAYVYDRFHADGALDAGTADRVNEEWVRNSCLGRAADAVMVAEEEGTVLGYATCTVDGDAAERLGTGFGTIVMVATAAEARNRGVAKAATAGALEWFRRRGVEIVEVGTQMRNIPAGRLYEECGFRLASTSLTLRKVL